MATSFNKPNSQIKGRLNSSKKIPAPRTDNILEALWDIGGDSFDSLNRDVLKGVPRDFRQEILGWRKPKPTVSGELLPGQTLNIENARLEENVENKRIKSLLAHEQSIRQEERALISKKDQELKLELLALKDEVVKLSSTTQGLSKDLEITAAQTPPNPGVYHIIFFKNLLELISTFRNNFDNASVWMQSHASRTTKKRGYWDQVQKSGAKRLLSAEDYNQRSAG